MGNRSWSKIHYSHDRLANEMCVFFYQVKWTWRSSRSSGIRRLCENPVCWFSSIHWDEMIECCILYFTFNLWPFFLKSIKIRLPLNISSVSEAGLAGNTGFFVSWLTNLIAYKKLDTTLEIYFWDWVYQTKDWFVNFDKGTN